LGKSEILLGEIDKVQLSKLKKSTLENNKDRVSQTEAEIVTHGRNHRYGKEIWQQK
jgi:hypothetical protein